MERQETGPGDQDTALTYRRLLGARLYVHCGVRAAVALMVFVPAFVAHETFGVELPIGALGLLAAFIALYNLAPWILSRPFRDAPVPARDYRKIVTLAYGTIVLDYLTLTCALWLVGGCRTPFVVFYVLHVIVSAVLLSRREALTLTGVAYALLVLLVLSEWTGLVPQRPGALVGDEPLEGGYALTILVVYVTLFGLTCYLLLGVTRSLRSGERRIHIANAELSRLSEQRRDFLNIATHNLKAPLGAVTMFLENMLEELGGPVTDKQRLWLQRSLDRLGGLSEFLSEMQTLASLESQIITATFQPVDLAALLEGLVDEYQDVARERELELSLELGRPVPHVVGHDRLLREAVVNYLTNAIKYTPAGGHVEVRLLYREPHVRIEVVDDGVGLAAEDRERVFGEFVRVIRPDSPAAAVKGTGLGLSIVKRVAQAHDGQVGVESREGQGSKFFMTLPPLLE